MEREEEWPTEEAIRNHAYELFIARMHETGGSDVDDWLKAEAELRAAGPRAIQRAMR
jgi:hypothetical protein